MILFQILSLFFSDIWDILRTKGILQRDTIKVLWKEQDIHIYWKHNKEDSLYGQGNNLFFFFFLLF